MGCDMCGEDKRLYETVVEGVDMQLCDNCKVYGEVKRALPTAREIRKQGETERRSANTPAAVQPFEMIVEDYGDRIKKARESRKMTQEELAKKLAMKLSQLHKFESNIHKPDLETAHKLEGALNITLVENYVEETKHKGATTSGPITIADLIKRR